MIPIPFLHYLMIFSCTDLLEIVLISITIYAITCWLARDKQKQMVLPFYGACFLLLIAHHLHLAVIEQLLLMFTPAIAAVFILFHQKNLQKNFIASKSIIPVSTIPTAWLDELIKSVLIAGNQHKEFFFLIEGNDNLHELAIAPFMINAPLHKQLLTLFMDNELFKPDKFIWITAQGMVKAINVTWQQQPSAEQYLATIPTWQQDGMLATSTIDARILHYHAQKKVFTLISNGIVITDILMNQLHQILKRPISSKIAKETAHFACPPKPW